jgi:hypothetical protein
MQNKNVRGTIEINQKANLLCLSADFKILDSAINN